MEREPQADREPADGCALTPLLVIGDALLDRDICGAVRGRCPDAQAAVLTEERRLQRPGGAALAAALARAGGRHVTLLTALAADAAGAELRALLRERGVEVIDLGLSGPTPEKIRLRSGDRSLLRLDRGAAPGAVGPLTSEGRAVIAWASAILVSDYGRGMAAAHDVRAALSAVVDRPIVWDPHPRGARPVKGVTLATPNESEVAALERGSSTVDRGRRLLRSWGAQNVCVTCGSAGAVLCGRSLPLQLVETVPRIGDACGAGDAFSAAAAGALADGADVLEAVRLAVERASELVGGLGAATWTVPARRPVQPGPPAQDAHTLARRVRDDGGVVVATGGCFDLLHTGHLQTLARARALGDCLIVCLNSDASVRRLKGPARPLQRESDRVALLRALQCVDAVAVFDEDTPVRLLQELRPHIWAKGGDYVAAQLPERLALERWGGRVQTLPYLDGHSTTRLLEEVACRGAG